MLSVARSLVCVCVCVCARARSLSVSLGLCTHVSQARARTHTHTERDSLSLSLSLSRARALSRLFSCIYRCASMRVCFCLYERACARHELGNWFVLVLPHKPIRTLFSFVRLHLSSSMPCRTRDSLFWISCIFWKSRPAARGSCVCVSACAFVCVCRCRVYV